MQIEQGFADVNGTRLYYEMAGSGHPLVLIHGFTLDTRMWDDQFEVFAQHYQVVRYDLRSFGQSALPTTEAYSHLDDLRAQMVETYSGWHMLNDDPVRIPEPPAIERLGTLNMPTLVLVGERDFVDFRRAVDIMEKQIAGAKKVVMPGIGHMSNMEEPKKFDLSRNFSAVRSRKDDLQSVLGCVVGRSQAA